MILPFLAWEYLKNSKGKNDSKFATFVRMGFVKIELKLLLLS